jgi:hypothetical protein
MDRINLRNCFTICNDEDQKYPSKKLIKSKFVFRHKLLPDNTYKYKARLVARGYSQKYGISSIHLLQQQILMNLAAIFDWEIESLDVKNAYLEAPLDHEIYMNLPVELYQDNNQPIIKLNKCLYGLKQAEERWNNFINDVIQQCTVESDICGMRECLKNQ